MVGVPMSQSGEEKTLMSHLESIKQTQKSHAKMYTSYSWINEKCAKALKSSRLKITSFEVPCVDLGTAFALALLACTRAVRRSINQAAVNEFCD
ncbi:hypothetical protein RND71_018541 [Anisodus tanguticus]|uniref:Uncharacterized protein n=1 Tax=Anisodus tanguticus TaxID=243964 RepID=A0AAE1S4E8_9SOLA|nr:hypothetical protein RND71_018541 [Anisodus tanguticus]